MHLPQPLPRAIFKKRLNRFLGLAELNSNEVEVYIPNPGRLQELLIPGATIYIHEKTKPGRKTRFDLILVEDEGVLVSIDSRIPNRLFEEALKQGTLKRFEGFHVEAREFQLDDSRIDFLLGGPRLMLVEVKSCTLVEGDTALFPDAPTERGRRHLRNLTYRPRGFEAAIVFIIQRGDAVRFRPNSRLDPEFTEALREAHRSGVEVYAYLCQVTPKSIEVVEEVPVEIPNYGKRL